MQTAQFLTDVGKDGEKCAVRSWAVFSFIGIIYLMLNPTEHIKTYDCCAIAYRYMTIFIRSRPSVLDIEVDVDRPSRNARPQDDVNQIPLIDM